jgi:hypothetical protein
MELLAICLSVFTAVLSYARVPIGASPSLPAVVVVARGGGRAATSPPSRQGADHLAPLAHHPRPAAVVVGPVVLQHGIAWQQMQLRGRMQLQQQMQLRGWMEAELDANTTALTARLWQQRPVVELNERAWRFRLAGLGFSHAMHGVGRVSSPHH